MQNDILYMRRCLDLAKLAQGRVSPNPMVGAALVYDGQVLAENYHRAYGKAHAEVLVIQEVLERYGPNATEILRSSTLYVTLEPCSHQGKTPPCADLILTHGIPKVVIAMRDPSAKVNGKGVERLRTGGVEVVEGVLEEEARWLNRRFVTQHTQNRPYIILNWAQTADGFMAPLEQEQKWISGPESGVLVHRWRSEEDAILVGSGTALADDPQLTVRHWPGGQHPRRVLIDKSLRVPNTARMFQEEGDTIVFNESKTDWTPSLKYIALENFDLYLPQQIAYQLFLMDVQSLIVEGGVKVLDTFVRAGLWDEARVVVSPNRWGKGRKAPALEGGDVELFHREKVGKDELYCYKKG